MRHADAADAGVDAHVNAHGPARTLRFPLQEITDGRVDHRHDIAVHEFAEIALVEGTHQEDGLADATVTKRNGLVELDDGEAGDLAVPFEGTRDMGHTQPVAVVLDDRQHGTLRQPGDFGGVVRQVAGMYFDPRVE